MNSCERLRPALLRAVDGEAAPSEALRVARHAAACTACRIAAHRERRLRSVLDGLEDAPPDAAFLERVMEALPSSPPPPPIGVEARRLAWLRRRRNRVLGLLALVAGPGAAAALAAASWWTGGHAGLPHLAHVAEGTSALGALVTALLVSTERLSPWAIDAPHLTLSFATGVAPALLVAGVLACSTAALGLRRLLSAARAR